MNPTPVAAALAALLASGATHAAPPSDRDWANDLDALLAKIEETHPNPYHTTSRSVLDVQIAAYRRDLRRMTEAERVAGMARLLAMIGDGHTWMPLHPLPFDGLPAGPGFRSLPVRFELFDDGLYIVGANEASHVGKRVVAIGSVPVSEAIARTMELLPHDAANFSRELTPEWLMQVELLIAMGLSENPETVEITLTDGATETVVALSPLPAGVTYDWLYSMDSGPQGAETTWHRAAAGTPQWQMPLDRPTRLVPDLRGATYLQVFNIGNAEKTFEEVATEAVAAAEALEEPLLILDLRRCLGGDGSTNESFLQVLTESTALSGDGRIRILTGRQTHSAAIMLLSDLESKTRAIRYGQGAADRPNHYGETNLWVTPNAQLPVIIASEYYATSTPGDTRTHHAPDHYVPYTFADYASGRDPVLDAALRRSP